MRRLEVENALRMCAAGALLAAVVLTGCATPQSSRPSAQDASVRGASLPPMSSLGQRALGRAQAAIAQSDFASADDYLADARQHDPKHPDIWLMQARRAEASGDERDMGVAIERALAVSPGYGVALNMRGVWHCRQQRWAQAQADFGAALLDPEFRGVAQALGNAGVCALESGDLGLADTLLRQALALAPTDGLALISMARLEADRGNGLAARAFLQRREALGPLSAVELPVAISVETLAGDRRARARYEQALRQFMESAATASPPPSSPPSEGM